MPFHRKLGSVLFLAILPRVAPISSAGSLRVFTAQIQIGLLPPNIRIFFANDYTQDRWASLAGLLSNRLTCFPIEHLKAWSFVIVLTGEWKQLEGLGLAPFRQTASLRFFLPDKSSPTATKEYRGQTPCSAWMVCSNVTTRIAWVGTGFLGSIVKMVN